MSYRFMRVLIMFDLPSVELSEKREYRKFRKFLIRNGFVMLQESVYSKLALNATASNAVMENVRKNSPSDGIVQMLAVTEKQFSKMEYVIGEKISNVIDSDERLVIL